MARASLRQSPLATVVCASASCAVVLPLSGSTFALLGSPPRGRASAGLTRSAKAGLRAAAPSASSASAAASSPAARRSPVAASSLALGGGASALLVAAAGAAAAGRRAGRTGARAEPKTKGKPAEGSETKPTGRTTTVTRKQIAISKREKERFLPENETKQQLEAALASVKKEKARFAGGLVGGESIWSDFDYNFDPLGISEKFPDWVPWFREAELKHGRIAMLAFPGLIAPEFVRLPGLPAACANAGLADGAELVVVEAHDACIAEGMFGSPVSPMAGLLVVAGIIEVVTTTLKFTSGMGITSENAGDNVGRVEIGAKLGQLPKREVDMTVIKLQELKNSRLAMLAFAGAITQGALTAHGFPWWW